MLLCFLLVPVLCNFFYTFSPYEITRFCTIDILKCHSSNSKVEMALQFRQRLKANFNFCLAAKFGGLTTSNRTAPPRTGGLLPRFHSSPVCKQQQLLSFGFCQVVQSKRNVLDICILDDLVKHLPCLENVTFRIIGNRCTYTRPANYY